MIGVEHKRAEVSIKCSICSTVGITNGEIR